MPGNGTDISEQLVRNISARAEASIGSVLMLQQKILLWLKERRSQEASIREGIGEASFTNLCRSVDRRHGEQISYCELPKEVYEDMAKTGLLKGGTLRTYTAMQAANTDTVLLFYGSKDQPGMNHILDAMDAMYGRRCAVDKAAFEMLSEGKDLYVLEGLREQDVELLSYLVELPAKGKLQGNGSRKDGIKSEMKDGMENNAFPFTVIEQKGGKSLQGAGGSGLAVVCLDEDSPRLAKLMGYTAAAATSSQGERILEQIQYRIRGRQERNIAIEEAKKDQVIIDSENPHNMIRVTAKDYEFYKNNKVTETIPRSGPLNRVYDLVEGMSKAVIIDEARIKGLPAAQQQEAVRNAGIPISSLRRREVDIDMQDIFRQLDREEDVRAYLKNISGTTVKADPYGSLDHAVRKAQKEQRSMDGKPSSTREDWGRDSGGQFQ